MELEADHLGLFILHDAGYNMEIASQVSVRMSRLQHARTQSGDKGVFGVFRTHPTTGKRIEQLMATDWMIRQGARKPMWKK